MKRSQQVNIYPKQDWLIVRPMKGEKTSSHGIILPEKDQKALKTIVGKVEATGPGKDIEGLNGIYVKRMTFKIGDIVLYSTYAKSIIEDGKDEWHNVRADDIIAVLK
jgi:co-chaperonin GroES (HSP10)